MGKSIGNKGTCDYGVLEAITAFSTKMNDVNETKKNTTPCYGLVHFSDGSTKVFYNRTSRAPKKYIFANVGALKNSLKQFLSYNTDVKYNEINDIIKKLIEEGIFEIVKLNM